MKRNWKHILTRIDNTYPDSEFLSAVLSACRDWAASGEGFGPTSAITGDGAVGVAEKMFSEAHGSRPAILVPSATYGLYGLLKAFGVKDGTKVCCPCYDWPAAYAAIKAAGGTPVLVSVDPETLTLDPAALKDIDMSEVSAVIVTHIHGTAADVSAIRSAVPPGIPIIEDCSQAVFSSIDGKLCGTLGDAAVFSFGPSKALYAGEGGMVLLRDWDLYEKTLCETAHPVRQRVGGVCGEVKADGFSVRPHPLTPILLVAALKAFDAGARHKAFEKTASGLSALSGVKLIGVDNRRCNASGRVPAILPAAADGLIEGYDCVCSGAFDLHHMSKPDKNIVLVNEK